MKFNYPAHGKKFMQYLNLLRFIIRNPDKVAVHASTDGNVVMMSEKYYNKLLEMESDLIKLKTKEFFKIIDKNIDVFERLKDR